MTPLPHIMQTHWFLLIIAPPYALRVRLYFTIGNTVSDATAAAVVTGIANTQLRRRENHNIFKVPDTFCTLCCVHIGIHCSSSAHFDQIAQNFALARVQTCVPHSPHHPTIASPSSTCCCGGGGGCGGCGTNSQPARHHVFECNKYNWIATNLCSLRRCSNAGTPIRCGGAWSLLAKVNLNACNYTTPKKYTVQRLAYHCTCARLGRGQAPSRSGCAAARPRPFQLEGHKHTHTHRIVCARAHRLTPLACALFRTPV